MNERSEYATEAAEPDVDPRVVAVHRVVDLERQHQDAQIEADRRAKHAAILGEELRQARDDLSGLLGYTSSSNAKAMDPEALKRELRGRY